MKRFSSPYMKPVRELQQSNNSNEDEESLLEMYQRYNNKNSPSVVLSMEKGGGVSTTLTAEPILKIPVDLCLGSDGKWTLLANGNTVNIPNVSEKIEVKQEKSEVPVIVLIDDDDTDIEANPIVVPPRKRVKEETQVCMKEERKPADPISPRKKKRVSKPTRSLKKTVKKLKTTKKSKKTSFSKGQSNATRSISNKTAATLLAYKKKETSSAKSLLVDPKTDVVASSAKSLLAATKTDVVAGSAKSLLAATKNDVTGSAKSLLVRKKSDGLGQLLATAPFARRNAPKSRRQIQLLDEAETPKINHQVRRRFAASTPTGRVPPPTTTKQVVPSKTQKMSLFAYKRSHKKPGFKMPAKKTACTSFQFLENLNRRRVQDPFPFEG